MLLSLVRSLLLRACLLASLLVLLLLRELLQCGQLIGGRLLGLWMRERLVDEKKEANAEGARQQKLGL